MFSTRNFEVRLLLNLVALLLISFHAFAQKGDERSADRDSAKYVGADVCQGCHEDSYRSFAKSNHVETLENKNAADRACEACHGAGAAHVQTGGDPGKILNYAGAAAQTILARCSRCHQTFSAKEHTQGAAHCLTCHSAHHYRQLTHLLLRPQD
jgi:hypothetical protein